jgi:hypothetical protein
MKKDNTDNSEHFFECAICGQQVDMRDLGQVFEHEHDDLPKPQFGSSKKVGDSTEWLHGKDPVNIN